MSFWDWAVEAYGRPGVDGLCIEAQDQHGQSVPYLLWAAWLDAEGRRVGAPACRRVGVAARRRGVVARQLGGGVAWPC